MTTPPSLSGNPYMLTRLLCSGVLLAVASAIGAADGPPTPAFKLPVNPPPAVPEPSAVTTLEAGQVFVIQREADFRTYEGVKGILSIKRKVLLKGQSYSIDGVFVDGKGEQEEREYVGTEKGLYLAIIRPKKDGNTDVILAPRLADENWETRLPLTVKMKKGPQPPPDDGKVTPAPTTPVAWVVVVEETSQRTADTAKVLGDLAYWQSLTKRTPAVEWRFYDKDSPDAKQRNFDTFGAEIGLPAVLFLAADGKKLAGFKLPKSTAEIDAKLKEFNK